MKLSLSLGRPKPTILAILSAILLSLFVMVSLAPSAQAKTWSEMTLDEQILSYTYYYAVSECFARENGNYTIPYDLVANNQISDDGHPVRVGFFVDPEDGKRECKHAIHRNAISLWGYRDLEDALTNWGFESTPDRGGWQYKGGGNSPRPGYVSGVLNKIYGSYTYPTLTHAHLYRSLQQFVGHACGLSNPVVYADASVSERAVADKANETSLRMPVYDPDTKSMVMYIYSTDRNRDIWPLDDLRGTVYAAFFPEAEGQGDDAPGYNDILRSYGRNGCWNLADKMSGYAEGYKLWAVNNEEQVKPPVSGPVDGDTSTFESTCKVTGGLGYLLCPLMNTMATINDMAYSAIKVFLVTPAMMTTTDDEGGGSATESVAYAAWKQIRNLANVLFGVAFLIIIYSQLTSAGISNYGIKKMLPKLLVGIILVNTSYWIVAIAVDLSNVIGVSVYEVMSQMSRVSETSGAPGWSTVTANALAGTGLLAGVGVMLATAVLGPLMVGAVAMLVGLMFVLTFRSAMIFILAIIAPLAFVAYLLPNTNGMFRAWSKILRVLLYIFPAVAFVMGASNVAAAVTFDLAQRQGGVTGAIMMLIAVAMPAMGIFAALMLAKTMGSIMSKLGVSNPFSGAIGAAKDWAGKRNKQMVDNSVAKSVSSKSKNPFRRAVAAGARVRANSKAAQDAATRNSQRAVQKDLAERIGENDGDNRLARKLSSGGGESGRRRVIAEAKALESKELVSDIENIMSTMDKELASNPIELDRMFNIAVNEGDTAAMAAYQKQMHRNGSSGVMQSRESLAKFTDTSGMSEEDAAKRNEQIMNMKDILNSDDVFRKNGRDFEVWSNNEHTVKTGKKDAYGADIKVPHANFGDVSNDSSVWQDISAQRFAGMNQASQNFMLDQFESRTKSKDPAAAKQAAKEFNAFVGRMTSDATAMGQIKDRPRTKILEQASAIAAAQPTPNPSSSPTPPSGPSSSPPPPTGPTSPQSPSAPSNPGGGSIDSGGRFTPRSASEGYHDGMTK